MEYSLVPRGVRDSCRVEGRGSASRVGLGHRSHGVEKWCSAAGNADVVIVDYVVKGGMYFDNSFLGYDMF